MSILQRSKPLVLNQSNRSISGAILDPKSDVIRINQRLNQRVGSDAIHAIPKEKMEKIMQHYKKK